MKKAIRFLPFICLLFLVSSAGTAQVPTPAGAQENTASSQAQPAQATPSAEPLNAQLTRLVGMKKTMLVVKTNDGTIWSFHAADIKTVSGTTVTLKKRTPFVNGKSLGNATEDEVVERVAGGWENYGSSHIPWGGYWMGGSSGSAGISVSGVSGFARNEMVLEVASLLKVETQSKR